MGNSNGIYTKRIFLCRAGELRVGESCHGGGSSMPSIKSERFQTMWMDVYVQPGTGQQQQLTFSLSRLKTKVFPRLCDVSEQWENRLNKPRSAPTPFSPAAKQGAALTHTGNSNHARTFILEERREDPLSPLFFSHTKERASRIPHPCTTCLSPWSNKAYLGERDHAIATPCFFRRRREVSPLARPAGRERKSESGLRCVPTMCVSWLTGWLHESRTARQEREKEGGNTNTDLLQNFPFLPARGKRERYLFFLSQADLHRRGKKEVSPFFFDFHSKMVESFSQFCDKISESLLWKV